MHIDCPINPTVHFFSLRETKQKRPLAQVQIFLKLFVFLSGFEPETLGYPLYFNSKMKTCYNLNPAYKNTTVPITNLSLGVPPEQKGVDRHKEKKHLDQDLEIRVENLTHLWGIQIYRNYKIFIQY